MQKQLAKLFAKSTSEKIDLPIAHNIVCIDDIAA